MADTPVQMLSGYLLTYASVMDIDPSPPILTGLDDGLVLDIAEVGIHNPLPLPGETTYAYAVAADGDRYRLPDPLHEWVTRTLAEHYARREAGQAPPLPASVEFGVRDGRMFARRRPPTS